MGTNHLPMKQSHIVVGESSLPYLLINAATFHKYIVLALRFFLLDYLVGGTPKVSCESPVALPLKSEAEPKEEERSKVYKQQGCRINKEVKVTRKNNTNRRLRTSI